MKLPTRIALIGLGALGLLSSVHWARSQQFDGPPLLLYLLGVLPNVAAAIAIPYVVLSIWVDQAPTDSFSVVQKRHLMLTGFSSVGLIAWEFGQQLSRGLYFDPDDIVATIIGMVLGLMFFRWIKPPAADKHIADDI